MCEIPAWAGRAITSYAADNYKFSFWKILHDTWVCDGAEPDATADVWLELLNSPERVAEMLTGMRPGDREVMAKTLSLPHRVRLTLKRGQVVAEKWHEIDS